MDAPSLYRNHKRVVLLVSAVFLVLISFNIGFVYGVIHEGFVQKLDDYMIYERNEVDAGTGTGIESTYFTDSIEWEVGHYDYEGNWSSGEHVLENRSYIESNGTFLVVKYRAQEKPEVSRMHIYRSEELYPDFSLAETQNRNFIDRFLDDKLAPASAGSVKTRRFRINNQTYNTTPSAETEGIVFSQKNFTGYYLEPMNRTGLDNYLFRINGVYFELGEMNDREFRRDFLIEYSGYRLDYGGFRCGGALPLICS